MDKWLVFRIVSILTVFVNKALLSDINLEAPIFIALTQTFITAAICFIKKSLHKLWPERVDFPETSVFGKETIQNVYILPFYTICFSDYIIFQVLPVSIMFTCMIATNNLCLKYVSVAFYYIGRSLTTIFNVTFTYLILREKTSKICLFFCGLIVFGFYLGVDQESLAGTINFHLLYIFYIFCISRQSLSKWDNIWCIRFSFVITLFNFYKTSITKVR